MARDRATDTSALVAAAAEVFRDKGYRNATIDDIAEAAGISRPTVYKYTKSKRWLLDRMVDTVTEDLGRRLRSVLDSDDDALTRLRRVIATHVEAATVNRTFYAIVFAEETELSEAGRRRFRSWAHDVTSDFQTLLDECVEQVPGSVRLDTWIAANLILSMLTSLYRWYDPAGPTSPQQLSEQILLVIGKVLP
ncbi:TetR/AcrR family transcriptional regulator [Thermocrispum municipale]|jgi:AcrR family transcriptional regulator|uniref:TetR/AcrR family transcriptional regulator n=1 Tax=Thermocrispum municipale TaxID=37926 RepID=UPI00048F1C01|nr:TetR/AcrR family transcriptional regulator [Thermocrispum municipale]